MVKVDTPWRPAVRALALLACGWAILVLLAPAQAAAADVVAVDDEGAREYWTPERMKAAEPPPAAEEQAKGGSPEAGASAAFARSEVGDPTARGVRMHGKVFFTVSGGSEPGNYVCSGTAVNSGNASVVWTAGHCVYDGYGGGYASRWIFVPAYFRGSAPFGEWPAEALAVPDGWRLGQSSSYDYGAAVVVPNEAGRRLGEVVGSRPIGFNEARDQHYTSYGYPAKTPPPEFAGGAREFRCVSPLGGTDNPPGPGPSTNWIGCDMTGGSSGGGWIARGKLLSVNSYSYCGLAGILCEQRLYGPYLDDTAKRLYVEVAGKVKHCGGEPATITGTPGADKIVGTGGRDVIHAAGGNDTVQGMGGKDVICGGSGSDRLTGGGGNDRILGNRGRDRIKGGRGVDTCDGGAGRDTARGCEIRRRIP